MTTLMRTLSRKWVWLCTEERTPGGLAVAVACQEGGALVDAEGSGGVRGAPACIPSTCQKSRYRNILVQSLPMKASVAAPPN